MTYFSRRHLRDTYGMEKHITIKERAQELLEFKQHK